MRSRFPPRIRGRRQASAGPFRAPTFDWPTLIANKDREIARLEAAYTANARESRRRASSRAAPCWRTPTPCGWRPANASPPKQILIATGGAPNHGRTIPGIEHVISSNEAFHLPKLPRRIVIQGGGYIAVEFAGIFAGLGCRRDAGLSRRQHPARLRRRRARACAQRDGEARHHRSSPAARSRRSRSRGEAFAAHCPSGIEHRVRPGDVRDRPRAQRRQSRARERRRRDQPSNGGIAVDEYSRTTVPNIYAVGDVTHRFNLTPVAIREGHAFADTVFGKPTPGRPRRCADRGVLAAGGRRGRPDRSAGARALQPASTSTRRRSGR